MRLTVRRSKYPKNARNSGENADGPAANFRVDILFRGVMLYPILRVDFLRYMGYMMERCQKTLGNVDRLNTSCDPPSPALGADPITVAGSTEPIAE